MTNRPLAALLALVLPACVIRAPGDTDGGTESTGTPGTSGAPPVATTTVTDGTSGVPEPTAPQPSGDPPLPTTDSPPTTTDDNTSNPDILPPDVGVEDECDPWIEDCPEGQKCAAWASGGQFLDATKCVDIVPDPDGEGEPCTVVGSPVSGEDSCDKHLMCWNVDPDTLAGTCVAMCLGQPEEPVCADPGAHCSLNGAGVPILCIPGCDPLAPECAAGEVCIPDPADVRRFLCVLDASGDEGQVFDPCEFANVCDPGLLCQSPGLAAECDPMIDGCCLPFCDTTEPDACPGQGLGCVPFYAPDPAPPGKENLGTCRLPMP